MTKTGMSCPDGNEAEAAAPTLPPVPAPGPAPPRAATVVTADSAAGEAKDTTETDTTSAKPKNMGKKLAKLNFKFPDYSKAQPKDFSTHHGNLIGGVLVFKQNTGNVKPMGNVNW